MERAVAAAGGEEEIRGITVGEDGQELKAGGII